MILLIFEHSMAMQKTGSRNIFPSEHIFMAIKIKSPADGLDFRKIEIGGGFARSGETF